MRFALLAVALILSAMVAWTFVPSSSPSAWFAQDDVGHLASAPDPMSAPDGVTWGDLSDRDSDGRATPGGRFGPTSGLTADGAFFSADLDATAMEEAAPQESAMRYGGSAQPMARPTAAMPPAPGADSGPVSGRINVTRGLSEEQLQMQAEGERAPSINPRGEILNGVAGPVPSPEPASGERLAEGQEAPVIQAELADQARESDEAATKAKPQRTWKPSPLMAGAARLLVGTEAELPLDAVETTVRIDGYRARVLMDFQFTNTLDQQLEGTFQLRLPEGATPYFLAFGANVVETPAAPAVGLLRNDDAEGLFEMSPKEIMNARARLWEQPKEARMVPREKAAQAYIDTVRQQVDPALLEWAAPGVFNTRVFPLQPGRRHRVVLGYDVDLTAVGDDWQFQLTLPQREYEVGYRVDVSIADLKDIEPRVEPTKEPIRIAGRQRFSFGEEAAAGITVRIPQPPQLALQGRDEETGSYLATRFVPSLDKQDVAGQKRAVFMVDISLSSQPERFALWLELMQAILNENRDSLDEFAVCFFNVEQFWWREEFTANTPENVGKLVEFYNTLALQGATDLAGALTTVAQPAWLQQQMNAEAGDTPGGFDVFLLSDGAVTWGEDDLLTMTQTLAEGQSGALFAYQTGLAGTDSRTLDHLARETGGAVFSVVGQDEIATAAKAHRARPWQIVDVKLNGISDIILAGRPTSIFPGQRLMLAGRGSIDLANDLPSIELVVARDGETQTVRTPLERVMTSELAPRMYGQIAVDQLEQFQSATETLSESYACHFRVTGQTCSLLMLETEEDYKRYEINPREDAKTIGEKPVAETVALVIDELGDQLSDPKRAFLAWLNEREGPESPFFRLPTAVRQTIDTLPSDTFAVNIPGITCEVRTRENLPAAYVSKIEEGEITWPILLAEAERRRKAGSAPDAICVLSGIVEMFPGDTSIARDVADQARAWGLDGQAYYLLKRVARQRPWEPQTFPALGETLAKLGKTDLAMVYYELAMASEQTGRFGEFKRIAALDYIRLLREVSAGTRGSEMASFAQGRMKELSEQYGPQEADLMVAVSWTTDSTDVDLHIIEPNGEHCFYQHRQTEQGGYLTTDVTQGYGPEMYVLTNALPGDYKIYVHYFSSNRNRAGTRTRVLATVYENWGKPNERVSRRVLELDENKEDHGIAVVKVKR
jgi:hypothetical protein